MFVAGSLRCLLVIAATGMAAQTTESPALDPADEATHTAPGIEPSRSNVLRMGLRISADLDDNALNNNQNPQANLVTSIQPRLGWHFSRARIDWATDYSPALSRSQNFSVYDSFSHVFENSFQLKLTRRLRIRLHENFLKSTNPFEQLRAAESATGPALGGVPNDTVPATSAEVRTEQASLDMVYAASAHSKMGVVGEFLNARYNLQPAVSTSNQLLQSSSTVGAHAYYSRQVTRHQWIGFDYHVQKLVFNSQASSVLVHNLVYIHTIALSGPMSFSFFAGPEQSSVEDMAGTLPSSPIRHRSTWHLSGGATTRWSGIRTSVVGRLSRSVGDGGILGAVRLSKISVEIRRTIAQQWTASLLVSYDDSKALTVPAKLSYGSAAAGLTRTLGRSFSIETQYWWAHLASESSVPSALSADHNRVSVSLIYDLTLPLGR